MVEVTMWVIVIVLFIFGVYQLIRYFTTPPDQAAMTYALSSALLAIFIGVFMLADKSLFSSILPGIWGILLILGGLVKIQESVDALRLGGRQWWMILLGAVVSIVLGVIAITHPADVLNGVAIYIGVSLIVEACIDCGMLLLLRKFIKNVASEIIDVDL